MPGWLSAFKSLANQVCETVFVVFQTLAARDSACCIIT